MRRRPPIATRTATLCPDTTPFRSCRASRPILPAIAGSHSIRMASSATIRNSTPPDEGMLMTNDDLVLQTIEPVTHDLGGFKVHRTLPNKARTMVGPFLFFDQMGPAHLSVGPGMEARKRTRLNSSH